MAERGRGRMPEPRTLTEEERVQLEKEAELAKKAYLNGLAAEKAASAEPAAAEPAAANAAPNAAPAKLPYHLWILQQAKNPKLTEKNWRERYNSYVAQGGRRRKHTRKHTRKHKKSRKHRR